MDTIDAPVPCDVLDIAIEAARAAGAELAAGFGHPHGHDADRAERAAAAAARRHRSPTAARTMPSRMRLGGDRAATMACAGSSHGSTAPPTTAPASRSSA